MENRLQNKLIETKIDCPYCGEQFITLLDTSIDEQQYIEDCQVCCSPIVFNIKISTDGHIAINTFQEND